MSGDHNHVASEFRQKLIEASKMRVPLRLYTAMAYNLELANFTCDILAGEKRRQREAVIIVLARLLAEADILGIRVFKTILGKLKSLDCHCRGVDDSIIKFFTDIDRTAYMLFYLAIDAEPHSPPVCTGRRVEGPPQSVSDETVELITTIARIGRSLEEYDSDYVKLHLSRAYSELARIAYSVRDERLRKHLSNILCNADGRLHECIVRNRVLPLLESGGNIVKLGYIQLASTVSRSDLYKNPEIIDTVRQGLREAEATLQRYKEDNLDAMEEYDALSLYGSYHYNNGWIKALEYTPQAFHHASKEFRISANEFMEIDGRVLGFVRGAYVALWNYYLMGFNSYLMRSMEISEKLLEDAQAWGSIFADAIRSPENMSLVNIIGIHGYYSLVLAYVSSLLVGKDPAKEGLTFPTHYYPEKIASKLEIIDRLYSNNITADTIEKVDCIYSQKPIIKDIIRRIAGLPDNNVEERIESMINDVRPKEGITIRELPLLSGILKNLNEGNNYEARKLAILLVTYTL